MHYDYIFYLRDTELLLNADTKLFYQFVHSKSKCASSPNSFKHNGRILDIKKYICDTFSECFSTNFAPSDHIKPPLSCSYTPKTPNSIPKITPDLITVKLKNLKTGKTPGSD